MEAQKSRSFGSSHVIAEGSCAENEDLKVADPSMISAYARYKQFKNMNPSSAQSKQNNTTDFPRHALQLRDNSESSSSVNQPAEMLTDTAAVFCSGKVVNSTLGAPIEMSRSDAVQCGSRESFDTNDSALGESLSETDAQKHEPPISPSSLIIKFSTISPGRINAVERRGSISYPEQAHSSSDQGDTLNPFQNDISTPKAESNRKRGRPPGSKNKNSASKLKLYDRGIGNQRQTTTPSKAPAQSSWDVPLQKKTSPALSEAMKVSWAKRRDNGTDGHRGGPPTEQTIVKRRSNSSIPDKDYSTVTGQSDRNPQRQLFKGQHAIRSASAPKLPMLTPKATIDAEKARKAAPYRFDDKLVLPVPRSVTSSHAGLLPHSVIPTLCKDDPTLRDIFTLNIYPALNKSMIKYQGILPDTTLIAVCKQVANEIVDERFQTFLRESKYQLDKRQRKRIKQYVKQTYAAKVRHTQENVGNSTVPLVVDQQRKAKNTSVAATTDYFGGQYTHLDKQTMAKALHDKDEATQGLEIREVGRANSQKARPRRAETTVKYGELVEGDVANLRDAVASTNFKPVMPKNGPQVTHEDNGVPQKQHSKKCNPCRQSGTKCILQGSSCEAFQDSEANCFFQTVDDAPKAKANERAVARKGGVLGQADFRRCIRCRQKHNKCIPSGDNNCEGCDQAGLVCSFRPTNLDFNVKPPSDHWDASASLQSTFTGTIKDQQPRRHGSVPESLHHDPHGQATFRSVRSSLQSNSGHEEESLQISQISPRKLRGHTRIPRDVESSRDDLSEDIDWYDTLYPGHNSQRISDKTALWNFDPTQPRSPRLLETKHTKLPVASNPELELAAVNASICEMSVDRPYRSSRRGHYDFVKEEYASLLLAVDSFDQVPYQICNATAPDLRLRLKARLGRPSEERMTAIIKSAQLKLGTALAHRKRKNIRRHLVDLIENTTPPSAQPRFALLQSEIRDPVLGTKHTLGSLLRNRELGYSSLRNRETGHESQAQRIDIQRALYQRAAEPIRPWRSWKGASSDVVTVAWAPDSVNYAAGAAAQSDDLDLQYNRPRNLLFGDLNTNTISELPDHRIARPRPETVASGPNSTYAVYQACDPMVYKTVTSVHFSRWGGALYTASHDKTVKIWDTASGLPRCSATITHDAEVTSLELSNHYPGYFATASKTFDNSVRVYRPSQLGSQSGYLNMSFSSERALKHRNHAIYPECIRWGLTPGTKHLLLAGFQQWADQDYSASRQGEVCLWDVNTGASTTVRPRASAIFAVAWHPYENLFITGGAPGGGLLSFPKTTKSVVRSYDIRNSCSFTHEFECPALDIQDVTFHPNSSNYVTAGCTNGTSYVWDYRWPDEIIHELHHGEPIQELPPNDEEIPYAEHREKVDAGVLLSIWGKGGSLLYTGSSDGMIKTWDILRAPEDVWVRDVASLPAGIQSGSLSPDGMNLLVGDAVGGVHVLSAAPFGLLHTDLNDHADDIGYNPDPITFVYADANKDESDLDNPGTEGIELAKQYMESGQTVLHPLFGVGKGPNYQSPLALYARWDNLVSGYSELVPDFDQRQAFSIDGVEQPEFSGKIKTLVAARKEQMLAAKQGLKALMFALGDPTLFVANRSASNKPATQTFGTEIPSSSRNCTLSTNTTKPSSSELKASCPLALASTTPTTFSPPRPRTPETIDFTDNRPTSPITGNKRRRPSTPSIVQPSTPTNASKRIKLEYESPLKHPKKSPNSIRTTGIEIVDLTDDTIFERANAFYQSLQGNYDVNSSSASAKKGEHGRIALKGDKVVIDLSEEDENESVEENLLTWEEWVEEDHWWPTMF